MKAVNNFSLLISITALVALTGCGDDGRVRDSGMSCLSDVQCDDGIACTVDTCGVGSICHNDPLDDLCAAGESCNPTTGCGMGASCMTDEECDDAIDCTFDTCGVGNLCNNNPLNERCGGTMMCDPSMGCVGAMGCTADSECDDSIDCTIDSCGADMTCRNMPIDGRCTGEELCNPTAGCVEVTPCDMDSDCDDGVFCNGMEVCQAEFSCDPVPVPRMCDDSDDCTLDTCDMGSDMCVFACDTSRPECDCPVAAPTCAGAFTVTSAPPNQNCALGFVNYNITRLDFENVAGIVSITASSAHFGTLTDATGPACPDFEANAVISGDCNETYVLRGSFSDADNFTGTFEAQFMPGGGGLGCFDCVPRSFPVTATRM